MVDPTRIYLSSALVRGACNRAFWPLLFTRLVTDLELSPLQLVLLGTVYEAGIFLAEIPTGVVADLVSRRLSVIIGFALSGSAFIMSALVENYALLVVSQVLVGISWTFFSGAETAWITDELGSVDDAEPVILRGGRFQLLGAVIGIVAFSGVAVVASLSTAIVATGVVMLLWAVYLVRAMGEEGFTRTEGQGWSDFFAMLASGFRHVRGLPVLRILAVVTFIGGVAKEAIDRLDIQRLDDVGFPDDVNASLIIGVLVAIRLLLSAGLLVVAERKVRGEAVVPSVAVLLVGVAGGIALLAHVELLAIAALGLILQGGFFGAIEPLRVLWTNAFATAEARATIHSFMGQGESIGEVVGGIALGTVAEVFTVPTAMTVSIVLFVLAAGYTATARRHWTAGR